MIFTSDTPSVSKDIVGSTMHLLGYTKEAWRWVYLLTFANVFLMSYAAWLLLPRIYFLPALTMLMGFAAGLAGRLIYLGATYAEHTLAVRNALERRLGVPEHARHRETYGLDSEWVNH